MTDWRTPIDTPCLPVSIWDGNEHMDDLRWLDEIETWVTEQRYSTYGLPVISGIDLSTTDYATVPRLVFTRPTDEDGAAYLAWNGRPAASTPPATAAQPTIVTVERDHTRRLTTAELTVTADDLLAAILQFATTGTRPTCAEWPDAEPGGVEGAGRKP
ncbi:immunity protein Imm1 of predicted polymorphic toxin system [Stackebrandtia albiflava]|uniref:Immunity protein Imm1 of predicted polymorphic toxin system n=1 Tax=Stackebrandtia albiflava TaxID=406432 RepID=A0A562V2I2_9ACTN|nr:Imm1 family immunity protein [Stackebrandtia albiflava]TWJ12084.1 immunity protein Imm1 of predicted polymorphic toxin system [Stackebrandtia albiflava]